MNTERLKKALAIIEQIPDKSINLSAWRELLPSWHESDVANCYEYRRDCGTIACAAGWLAMHPDMKEQGLYSNDISGEPILEVDDRFFVGYHALAKFFEMSDEQTFLLFCCRRGLETVDPELSKLSHKELWLHRAAELLKNHT